MHNILVLPSRDVLPDRNFVKNCAAIINVSDTPCSTFEHGVPSFWFPINELGDWGYAPFFGALRVLQRYEEPDGRPVIIHCHAGVHRSMSVALALQLSCGHKPEDIELKPYTGRVVRDGFCPHSLFQRSMKVGHIPDDVVAMLVTAKQHPDYSLLGCLCQYGSPGANIRALTECGDAAP